MFVTGNKKFITLYLATLSFTERGLVGIMVSKNGIMSIVKKYLGKREEGQGLVEYALILVLVAIVVIAILLQLGPQISYVFCEVNAVLSGETCATGGITNIEVTSVQPVPGGANLSVTVTTSETLDVTVSTDLGSDGPKNCSTSCSFTVKGPYPNGVVNAQASGGFAATTNY